MLVILRSVSDEGSLSPVVILRSVSDEGSLSA